MTYGTAQRLYLALLLSGTLAGSVFCSGEGERPSGPASTSTRPPVKQTSTPAVSDCRALADITEERGSLKLCRAVPAAPPQECPTADEIVVLVDNDNETAARRRGQDVPATNWQDLLVLLEAVGRTECRGGSRPLERLPGRCGTIQGAVGGWNFGPCRNAAGQFFPRFITTGSGTTTPATEAVQRIAREMTRAGRAPAVTLMAFDGIVDGDYRNAAARLAFGDAVADAVAAGLKAWIVASPADYRYIYVFARPQFEEFGDRVSRDLALTLKRNGSHAVSASLSEGRFRDPAARAEIAHVQVRRPPLSGVHWDFNGLALRRRQHPADTHGEMWKVDIRRWTETPASTTDAYGALLTLSWNADSLQWDSLVPFGVRLSPPSVLLNRPVHTAEDSAANAAWARAEGVEVRTLENCAPRLGSPIAQGASIGPGRADFLLIRGAAANAAWLNNGVPNWTGKAPAVRAGLVASSGPPLLAAALVTPPPRPSRCTEILLNEFAGSHRWGSGRSTPNLAAAAAEPDCDSERWKDLIEGLRQVPQRRFRPGASSPWSPTDGRVAAETFLTVIERVARRLAGGESSGVGGESCVLGTLQLESAAGLRNDPQWEQEPLQ